MISACWYTISKTGITSGAQTPAAQTPEAHALPQAPQCSALVEVLVSQPLVRLVSQSPKPVLHVKPQTLDVQALTALAGEGHDVPHLPQLEREMRRSASQPFNALPSQSPKPVLHVPMTHVLAIHTLAAFANAHALSHRPQCATLVDVSTQSMPHWVRGEEHIAVHTPSTHTEPLAQARLHMPQ